MKTIKVRTAAWFGDIERSFDIPDEFEFDYIGPADAPPVSQEDITESLHSPMGTSLKDMAVGKRNVVVVVDDLGRPTPAWQLIPSVVQELEAAGVSKDHIRFLIATGSHRQLTRDDMTKKLGENVVNSYAVDCHDAFKSSMKRLGHLENGFPIVVNQIAAEADLLVGIGCVIPHACHGFGGGAKLFCPGVAGMESIVTMHGFTPKRGRAVMEVADNEWDMRSASEAFAGQLPPIFLINVVVNTRREISAVYCGDFRRVFEAAKSFAASTYRTVIKPQQAEKYDVVLVNMYPLDSDPVQSGKSPWIKNYFPQALPVQINSSADGIDYHGWKLLRRSSLYRLIILLIGEGLSLKFMPRFIRGFSSLGPLKWGRNWTVKAMLRNAEVDYDSFLARIKEAPVSAGKVNDVQPDQTDKGNLPWIFSEYYPPEQFKKKYPRGTLLRSWPDVVAALKTHFPKPRIAVITSATVQIPEWADHHEEIHENSY